MHLHGPMLDGVQQNATEDRVRNRGVDPVFRDLLDSISQMELDEDCLGAAPFHALVAVFLAFRAKHAAPSRETKQARINALQDLLKAHTPSGPPRGYTVVEFCKAPYSPVTLVRHGTTLYVAPRATRRVKEYFIDSVLLLKSVDGVAGIKGHGRAHAGFLRAANKLVAPVIELIAKERDVKGVVFCGHSLGGAVAQLLGLAYAQYRQEAATAAKDHQDHGAGAAGAAADPPPAPYKSQVVTFGSPRVGDADFRNLLSKFTCHTRFYVAGDPVAGVPSPQTLDLWIFPSVNYYALHSALLNWRLVEGTHARIGEPYQPEVRLFFTAIAARRGLHALPAYAQAMDDHMWLCASRYWCTGPAAP